MNTNGAFSKENVNYLFEDDILSRVSWLNLEIPLIPILMACSVKRIASPAL